MKPEELISSAKVELKEEEQKITEKIIGSIYEKMKSNIKSGKKFEPVDISQEIRSNYNNKSSSKIFKDIVNRFQEDGYYIWNDYIFISHNMFKKWFLWLFVKQMPLIMAIIIMAIIFIINRFIVYKG